MNGFPILFAADWIWLFKIGGIIVVGLIYLINNLIQAANKVQRRPPPRPETRPDPRMRPRPAGRPSPQDEVAEFLRRATEKRAAKGGDGRSAEPRRAAAGEPVDPRILEMRAAAEKRQAAGRPPAAPPIEIVDARAVNELPSGRWPKSQTVETHVDTRQLAERAEQLMQVDRGDAAFEAHMQVFDHQVGRIHEAVSPAPGDATQPGASAEATPALRDVFAGLLADPQSVRQAIVLNEIIQRPVDRW